MKNTTDQARTELPEPSLQNDRFYRSAQVLSEDLSSGEVVLLHVTDGQYFTLNETGARIWHLLTKGLPIRDVAAEIAKEYDVSPNHALDGTCELVAGLERKRLVVRA